MHKTRVTGVLLVAVLLILGGCAPAPTAPVGETPTEDMVIKLQSEIATLREELSAKEASIEGLHGQINTLQEELSAKEVAIDALQQEIQEKQKRIEELESALEQEPSPPTVAQEWGTLESEYFIVKYYPGCEEDARKALDCATWVREQTMEKYPHDLGFKVSIYLHYVPEKWPTIGTAVAHSGSSSATIAILCPSWEGGWGGYEQLDNPFRRVLNHEYVHCPFYKDLYTKSVGYRDPPSWFNQGIAEYISENYLPSYENRVRESVQRGSFVIGEPYSWGLYIVEYMYVEYGQEKVVNLIKSDAPTFEDALRKEMGVSPSEFEDSWRAYLAEKF